MIRVALPIFAVLAPLQVVVFGANMAIEVAEPPAREAGRDGGRVRDAAWPPMTLVGWTDPCDRRPRPARDPRACSASSSATTPTPTVQGLHDFPADDRPNVNLVFQVYHLMINLARCSSSRSVASACPALDLEAKLWTARWMLRHPRRHRSCSPSWPPCRAGGPPSSDASRGSCGRTSAPTTRMSARTCRPGRWRFSIVMFALLYTVCCRPLPVPAGPQDQGGPAGSAR